MYIIMRNEEKINRVIRHWNETDKSLEECMYIVWPDIKLEVLQKVFNNRNTKVTHNGKA